MYNPIVYSSVIIVSLLQDNDTPPPIPLYNPIEPSSPRKPDSYEETPMYAQVIKSNNQQPRPPVTPAPYSKQNEVSAHTIVMVLNDFTTSV